MPKMDQTCKLDYISRPDGSVLYSEGETVVAAGIYGPVEVKANKILIDRASVEAHFRPKSGLPGVKDRLYESIIRGVCETAFAVSLFPRSSIVVVIQEMQNNGQLMSCALNAACLAALSSGIDMRFMFAAVTCFLHRDGTVKLAPPANEQENKAIFLFVFDSVDRKILTSHTEGTFTEVELECALSLSREQSDNVLKYFRSSLTIK